MGQVQSLFSIRTPSLRAELTEQADELSFDDSDALMLVLSAHDNLASWMLTWPPRRRMMSAPPQAANKSLPKSSLELHGPVHSFVGFVSLSTPIGWWV